MSTFDRNKARDAVIRYTGAAPTNFLLDALAGCVTDEPPTIDRDELIESLEKRLRLPVLKGHEELNLAVIAVDHILALLRPAPAQTIDRDALADLLEVVLPTRGQLSTRGTSLDIIVNAVLALLRPDPRIAKLEALHRADYVNSGDDQERYERIQKILRGES